MEHIRELRRDHPQVGNEEFVARVQCITTRSIRRAVMRWALSRRVAVRGVNTSISTAFARRVEAFRLQAGERGVPPTQQSDEEDELDVLLQTMLIMAYSRLAEYRRSQNCVV